MSGIKSPATYGDYYWRQSVDASAQFDEDMEEAFAGYFSGMFADMPDLSMLPAGIQNFVRVLSKPPTAGFGGFALGVGVETVDEILRTTMQPAMSAFGRTLNSRALEKWITSQQANLLFSRNKITEGLWQEVYHSEGYEDVQGDFAYNAQMPYPTIPELMRWARYHGDPVNVRDTVFEKFNVPVDDFDMYEWFTLQVLPTGVVTKLFRRGLLERPDFDHKMRQIGFRDKTIDETLEDSWLLPNAMLLVQGGLQHDLDDEQLLVNISKADIHPDYAQTYLDAILTKPSTQDLIAYELRQDPALPDLDVKLRKLGIHGGYTDVYRTLAYQIPPVADIITMAVREAFTPDIAARFGQYEDYPDDLTEWGRKKGLTEEWTQRYWAAHWSLPSPQQGFEMLHRGIIDRDELSMLLRALDVMPYWRDRLTEMAFRPLTRVDVRRMYKEGILDEAGVYEAYLDHGYNPANAERMTRFTVQYVLSQQSKFTSTDVVTAFTKRMISRSEAYSLLDTLGIRSENITYILSTAEYKRQWAFTESKITGIRNLYKRAVYDVNKTRDELSRLNLPAEQIDVLMEQWWYEDKTIPTANWTKAETLKFIASGAITRDRGMQELRELGYDAEHIAVYLGSLS